MIYSLYIIFLKKIAKHFIGYSEDIHLRLIHHNQEFSTFTSKANDLKIIFLRIYISKNSIYEKGKEM